MQAFAWMTGDCANADEKADCADLIEWEKTKAPLSAAPHRRTTKGTLQPWGPDKGNLYISGPHVNSEAVEGSFGTAYHAALEALLAQDGRVRAGFSYKIGIV